MMDDLGSHARKPHIKSAGIPCYPHNTIPARIHSFHLSFCKASAGRLGQKPIGSVNALLCAGKVSKTLYQHYVLEQHLKNNTVIYILDIAVLMGYEYNQIGGFEFFRIKDALFSHTHTYTYMHI